jgi:transposase-like protein
MVKRTHYSIATRNEVLDSILNHRQSGKSVAIKFNIPYNTVMRWVRQESDSFPKPSHRHTTNPALPYHQSFGYQDLTDNDLTELKRQLKATRFELQVLTNQNQELVELLRDVIEKGTFEHHT